MATIVTRFAPSPTGFLHVGGARTALFNWLLARNTGGKFLLRIEDTDLARSTESAVDGVIKDLRWLGLDWDNADDLVYQSRRRHVYDAVIDGLLSQGRAYEAWETPEELTGQREQAQRAKRPYLYRRPTYTDEQVARFKGEGRTPVVRFAMEDKDYWFEDAVLGPKQGFDRRQVQDFVIRKADGMPTYHFAVVIDDAEMGVTHVLRGQEHLLNTVNHVALMDALGYDRPVFAHLPVILKTDGSKMSKRDRDKAVRVAVVRHLGGTDPTKLAAAAGFDTERFVTWLGDEGRQLEPDEHERLMPHVGLMPTDLPEINVHDFRKSGYLPETLNNFLALLGWSSGDDTERFTMDQLVSRFSLERVGRANAKFDYKKLTAFNTEACEKAPPERLLAGMKDYLAANPSSPLNRADDALLGDLLRMNAGYHVFAEVDVKSRFFFTPDDVIMFDPKAVEKVLLKNEGEGLRVLRELRGVLDGVDTWQVGPLEEAVKGFCDRRSLGLGKVAQPARVAVSGGTVSPPIFDTLAFLGRERTLSRIDRCLAHVTPAR